MVKVKFDAYDLLNDIISEEGHYIDFISCNEYTFWYLYRQIGMKSFLPIINTQCFINLPIYELKSFNIYQESNLERLLSNAHTFFNIKTIQYNKYKGSIHDFIRQGIQENQFVYTLYDSYYDTFLENIDEHNFHGHPISGYDDKKQIYYSIFGDEHKVKYNDFLKMFNYFKETSGTSQIGYFYLDIDNISRNCLDTDDCIKQKIIRDLAKDINDWKQETERFKEYVEVVKKVFSSNGYNKKEFALTQRLLFNTIMEGLHGNFIFKMRLFKDVFHTGDVEDFILRFKENRKKCILIANLYRKAAILIDEYPDDFDEVACRLKDNLEKHFIINSLRLLDELKKILKPVLQGGK